MISNSLGPRDAGWLMLDNRASGGALTEHHTYTCTHCNSVVILNPARQRERYKCRGCDHHICDNCAAARAAGAPCKTFKQISDEYLAQAERQSGGEPRILLP